MWIVPRTLSAFALDTEESSSDSEELASMFAQSVMWRSKLSAKRTWQTRLKRAGWIQPLSGRTLRPSQQKAFTERWTASLEDIPASRSAMLESEQEKTTPGTSGPTSESTSEQLLLDGFSSKTSKDTFRLDSPQSSRTWKRMVTKRRGEYLARKKSAHLTRESGCSSWPTIRASEYKDCGPLGSKSQKHMSDRSYLCAVVKEKNWATPQASDHVEGARTAKESNQKCLGRDLNQMKNWPTPTSMSRPRNEETMKKCLKFRKSKGKNSVPLYLEEKVMKEEKVENWPTPRAGNPGSRKPGTGGKILAEEAKKTSGPQDQASPSTTGKSQGSWPTARTSDAEGGRIKTEQTSKGFRSKREKSNQDFGAKLRDAVEMKKPPAMKLNPNWVEQLMGLPVGWTQLPTEWTDSDCSATESSPKQPKRRG